MGLDSGIRGMQRRSEALSLTHPWLGQKAKSNNKAVWGTRGYRGSVPNTLRCVQPHWQHSESEEGGFWIKQSLRNICSELQLILDSVAHPMSSWGRGTSKPPPPGLSCLSDLPEQWLCILHWSLGFPGSSPFSPHSDSPEPSQAEGIRICRCPTAEQNGRALVVGSAWYMSFLSFGL